MRLINTSTYELEELVTPSAYAILSHTWRDGEELSHAEYVSRRGRRKRGYKKISYLCTQARSDRIKYAWIDTVCIDKTSSAELSEAINSMFAWYESAQVCYVYLDDTEDVPGIEHSRWITRGWTLQELLAPTDVRFYNRSWTFLGTKFSLVPNLVRWTRIDQIALEDPSTIRDVSAAARMSWAASRRTSRVEDLAYCLLGIFDVNMPLIYGEKTKAFRRLQEEILRQSHDITLLAFDRGERASHDHNLFAPDPDVFGKRPKIIDEAYDHDCELTSRGLSTSIYPVKDSNLGVWGVLPCRFEFDVKSLIALPLSEVQSEGSSMYCIRDASVTVFPRDEAQEIPLRAVTLLEKIPEVDETFSLTEMRFVCCLNVDALVSHGYEVIYAEPEIGIKSWDQSSFTSEIVTFANVVPVRKFGFMHRPHGEAFIVMLAVVRVALTDEVYLSAKSKPKDLDCKAWLEREGVYSTIKKQSFSGWMASRVEGEEPTELIVGNDIWELVCDGRWNSVPEVKLFSPLRLLSNNCFSEVILKVEASQHQTVWTICIEPGDHIYHEYRSVGSTCSTIE